jgi:tetraacyldisaccharide 4'-kinase
VSWTDLLLPLSPLYAAAVKARAAAYARGWLPSHRLGLPVVSVGNLSLGGTGKTPTVIALVRDLARRGRRPAVLTRGYRRSSAVPAVVVGPDPGRPVETIGDEPAELARRLPGVPIVVDADRVRGGGTAIALGADIVVLDDGFQHLRLERDLDLVLVDAGDPWGGGRLPPRGRLREPLAALARASAVLVTKVPEDHGPVVEPVRAAVEAHAGAIPVLAARLRLSRVRTAKGWQPADALAGRRLFAFAGVGRPGAFAALLEEAGVELAGSRWFPDHHRYTAAERESLAAAAAVAGATLVTTGKDAVKLPVDAPVWEVEAEMEPVDGSWDRLWELLPGGAP